MKYFLVLIILFSSCGKFIYSPYVSNAKDRSLNLIGLNSIIQRSTLFTNDFQVAIISDSHNYYKYLRKQIKLPLLFTRVMQQI
jgi:hypothetical protein